MPGCSRLRSATVPNKQNFSSFHCVQQLVTSINFCSPFFSRIHALRFRERQQLPFRPGTGCYIYKNTESKRGLYMCHKELELISLLSEQFQIKSRSYIEMCIRAMDKPMTVRSLDYGSGYANASFLDMMKRTNKQQRLSSIMDGFAPHDKHNGRAERWLRRLQTISKSGYVYVDCHLWNGSDVIPVRADVKIINGWLVAGFSCRRRPRLRPVATGHNLVCSQNRPTDRKYPRLVR